MTCRSRKRDSPLSAANRIQRRSDGRKLSWQAPDRPAYDLHRGIRCRRRRLSCAYDARDHVAGRIHGARGILVGGRDAIARRADRGGTGGETSVQVLDPLPVPAVRHSPHREGADRNAVANSCMNESLSGPRVANLRTARSPKSIVASNPQRAPARPLWKLGVRRIATIWKGLWTWIKTHPGGFDFVPS